MSDELREKLLNEVDVVDWAMLESHYDRGAVIVVSGALDLVDTAIAIANDNTEDVKKWLENQDLRSANDDDKTLWSFDKSKKIGEFLIVQPYVLVQGLKH